MTSTRRITISRQVTFSLLVSLCLAVAGCGWVTGEDDGESLAVQGTTQVPATSEPEPVTASTMAAPSTTTSAAPAITGRLPGEGVTVKMARANWSTGYMQAEIYRSLLKELGYDVPRPTEVGPSDFYPAVAAGEFDFWPNSWPNSHNVFFEQEIASGVTIADRAQYVGEEMVAGGLEGFLVDIPTADRYSITTLDDIATRPELAAIFDTNGNGIPDIAGCDEGWGCHGVINKIIADNGWEGSLEQLSGSHGALFNEQAARLTNGKPVLAYVWTPGAFVTELVPSEEVIWLGVRNPAPENSAPAPLPSDQCPFQPCTMGFAPTDIKVTANTEFLTTNPAAAKLLELVKIRVLDVNLQTVKMAAGEDSDEDIERHAAEWIEANRNQVSGWLWEAFQAA